MFLQKLKYQVKEKLPLIVGIGLIVSIHWTWLKLQDVTYLVKPEEKKEFPLFGAIRLFANKALNSDGDVSTVSSNTKNIPKSQ